MRRAVEMNTYYLTTPIYYVNDSPHIGHAYTTLACDVQARFMRLDGYDVKFITGTDEHGQKVEKSARAAGMTTEAFVDKVSTNFRELAKAWRFSNDDFVRTTEPRHIESCQALWRALQERNEIYLGSYAGWYAVRDEAFYAEDELGRGANGERIAPSGAEVEWVEEASYFFRLSDWGDRLLQYYKDNPDFIAPESRRNEVISFVEGGLLDLSVSRTSFRWGIPVPDDPDHVMYVWLDALTNYLTGAGYPNTECADFTKYWPANLHMVGKDILRFHAVYWPAFLMAAGIAPPRRIFAHGWWTNEGQKISKSLGNIIDPHKLVERYGLDPVRYFLLRQVPFGKDGDFSHRAVIGRINSDLANDYGNLVQRVLSMIHRNCGAAIPQPASFSADDEKLLESAQGLLEQLRSHIHEQRLHTALIEIWAVIGKANRYVDAEAPWKLRKTDPERMQTVLYVLAETIRRITLLLQPFMPDSTDRILGLLSVDKKERSFGFLADNDAYAITPGTPIDKPGAVFPRYVVEEGKGGHDACRFPLPS
jgi:methionyl-tRNA synthetase